MSFPITTWRTLPTTNVWRNRPTLAIVCLLAGLLPHPAVQAADDPGPAIAVEALRRSTGFESLTARLQMELINRRGQTHTRTLDIMILEPTAGGVLTLCRVRAPADVRGMAVLSHNLPGEPEHQWLYIPATQRVRRIAGTGRAGAFMGSEFTYHDLTARHADLADARLVRKDKHQQRACYVLSAEAPDPAIAGYTRQEVWIDQADFRVWRVDYFHPADRQRKTLTLSRHHLHFDRLWQAQQMEMANHLTGNRTRIHWQDLTFDHPLGPEDFTLQQLTRD